MRIPMNSFDADDMKLCRAHGDAIDEHREAVALLRWSDACAPLTQINLTVRAFEVGVHMPTDLPLPPSYWDDLKHWLQTLAPAKPAAQQPEPSADVWHSEAPSVAGVYETRINDAIGVRQDDGPRHFDLVRWSVTLTDQRRLVAHKRTGTAFRNDEIEWLRLIEADAPATKREIVDASLARLASTSGADGAGLVGAKLTHSVCIKAHGFADWQVGEIQPGPAAQFAHPENWLPCTPDGWIPHAAGDDCPVPVGVGCQLRLRARTVLVDISHESSFRTYGYWAADGNETITHWRPIAKDAS